MCCCKQHKNTVHQNKRGNLFQQCLFMYLSCQKGCFSVWELCLLKGTSGHVKVVSWRMCSVASNKNLTYKNEENKQSCHIGLQSKVHVESTGLTCTTALWSRDKITWAQPEKKTHVNRTSTFVRRVSPAHTPTHTNTHITIIKQYN